jgi:hypothetical protein
MAVPYTFGSATTSIPLSQLDSNFATTITLGNTAIQLGNTVTTLNNMTLGNVTVSSGNVVAGIASGAITQSRLATNVAGNGPAFSYYQSSAQTIGSINTFTKVTFTSNDFDTTSGMFASSRFTPTIAGYYQVSGGIGVGATLCTVAISIFKNGSAFKYLQTTSPALVSGAYGSALIYLDGSTDYIEIYASIGTAQVLAANTIQTYFQAAMVRSA